MAESFRNLSPETKKWSLIVGGLVVVLGPVVAALGLLVAGIAAIGAPVAAAIAGIGLLGAALIAFGDDIKAGLQTALDAVEAFQAQLVEAFAGSTEAMKGVGADIMSGLETGMKLGMGGPIGLAGSIGRWLGEQMRDAVQSRSPSKVFAEIGKDIMAGLSLGLEQGQEGTRDTLRGAVDGLGHEFSRILDPFKQALRDGKLEFEDFAQAVIGIGQRMADRLLDEAFRPIEDALAGLFGGGRGGSGAFGSIIGSLFGGSGGGSLFQGGGFGSLFSGVYAGGGMIPAGRWGIAGDEGPEIITGPARVFSNADSRDMMGGGPTIKVTNIFEGVNHATRAMLEGMIRESEARTLRAVPATAAAGFRRNPSLRR